MEKQHAVFAIAVILALCMYVFLYYLSQRTFINIGLNNFNLAVVKFGESDPLHTFEPYSDKDIKTFQNVCIVEKPKAKMIEIENGRYATEKDIVIYYSMKTNGKSLQSQHKSWLINITKETIPSSFTVVSYPAYFVEVGDPGNLYHWLRSDVYGIYGTMKLTNRLNSTEPNQVLHQKPIVGPPGTKNRTRYADLIRAFSVRDDQNVYHAMPSGTCYPYGIFGKKPYPHREVEDFITKQLDTIYPTKCPKGLIVTLLQRKTRRILNVDELLKTLLQNGFSNTKVAFFEDVGFAEQWRTIRCTNILVGVQGAGLQWCVFLRRNSGLLELAYDGWNFVYSKQYKNHNGLKTQQLKAKETYPDWKLISDKLFSGNPLNDSTKAEVFSKKNMELYRDLWGGAGFKWADSVYDPQAVLEKVKKLSKVVQK